MKYAMYLFAWLTLTFLFSGAGYLFACFIEWSWQVNDWEGFRLFVATVGLVFLIPVIGAAATDKERWK